MKTKQMMLGAALAAATLSAGNAIAGDARMTDAQMIERGRYIAKIGGCNDCHTPGYAPSGGKVAEKDWLVGDALGWKGDWGTTYPANLRLVLATMTETQWVEYARKLETRPPMPWFALHDLTEQDLRAFHRFVRSLGPAGAPAPAYVPPGTAPRGPFIQFPSAPPQSAAANVPVAAR
ncbi:MAG: cytochrome C [Burkholderiales bacterium]